MRPTHALITLALLLAGLAAQPFAMAQTASLPQANDAYFIDAENVLREKLAQQPITREARNIILFIGDGLSIPTITAARIYAGQKRGLDGVSHKLAMEQLPYAALSRTYSDDSQVADSAPSATAMTTGVKTINDVIGVNRKVTPRECASAAGNGVTTIFEMAETAGFATGIVSTARITHATPAAAYAHTPFRDWEADSDMPQEARSQGCADIAVQLVDWNYGDGFEVVLGGGRQKLMPSTVADPEYAGMHGSRSDGRDLTAEWLRRHSDGAFVWDRAGFEAVDSAATGHLLGLFEPDHMQYEADRITDAAGEPSLAEMTVKAIEILSKDGDGFVLMVEGGRIDHAHHAGNAARALEDTGAFDAAVAAALAATNPEETLIIVTADHSHTLTISGYPARDNPILGLVADADGKPIPAPDGKPYTTLGYANGPGAAEGERADLTGVNTQDIGFRQQALVPLDGETHGGDDVAIFANGPYAHLFQGVVDENFIYHVMAYASRIPEKAGLQ